jgi:hypothetical protein
MCYDVLQRVFSLLFFSPFVDDTHIIGHASTIILTFERFVFQLFIMKHVVQPY